MILQEYFNRKDAQGKPQAVTFMYEKFEVSVSMGGRQEVCEDMLRMVLYPEMKKGELEKKKSEGRHTYVVRSELEYRQCWHYAEQQYRALLAAAIVPQRQVRLRCHGTLLVGVCVFLCVCCVCLYVCARDIILLMAPMAY